LLRKLFSRDEIVVATKVFYPTTLGPNGRGLSRKHSLAAIDPSLARLGMDSVDLYQVHRWHTETPTEETTEPLRDVDRAATARSPQRPALVHGAATRDRQRLAREAPPRASRSTEPLSTSRSSTKSRQWRRRATSPPHKSHSPGSFTNLPLPPRLSAPHAPNT